MTEAFRRRRTDRQWLIGFLCAVIAMIYLCPCKDRADYVNGSFELCGAFAITLGCRQLYRDKIVRGVSVLHLSYFLAWGIWNLYYYPSLDQWFSCVGGIGVVSANAVYVAMLVYYLKRERDERHCQTTSD